MQLKTRFLLLFSLSLLLLPNVFNACSGVKFSPQEKASSSTDLSDAIDEDGLGICPSNDCNIGSHLIKKTVPQTSNKIDILLVVDNSVSMAKENAELSQRLGGMVGILEDAGASWQMCYVTTHVQFNSNAGRILEWKTNVNSSVQNIGSRVLSNSTPDKENVFKTTMQNISLGQGHDGSGTEQGIAATRLAVGNSLNSDCFRGDAAFTVLYLSDEDEKSCGGRCENSADEPALANWSTSYYTNAYEPMVDFNKASKLTQKIASLWPTKAFTAHAIVIKPNDKSCWDLQDQEAVAFYGIEYQKLQKATGGILGNICASSYSSQLTNIAHRTLDSMKSISLDCIPLAAPLVQITPAPQNVSVTRSGNKVFFNPGLSPGTEVSINYQCYE